MVVFTCAHCGDSVNKPKVEKHYSTKCRGRAPNLSCMDCFKDFFGNEHESHTKCISEAQRYGGAGFVDPVKKGEQKQNTWVELVQAALDESLNAPAAARRILQDVSKHSNTPRKKSKFVNFVRNVCGHRTMSQDIDAAWDVLSVQLERLKSQQAQNPQNHQNGQAKSADTTTTNGEIIEKDSKTEEEPVKNKKKDKKRKLETTADSTHEKGQAKSSDTTTSNGESMEVDSKSEEELVKNKKKDKKKKKFEAAADSTKEEPQNHQKGQTKQSDTTKTNGESMEVDSKTREEPVNNKKKYKKRELEATADSTQEISENQENSKAKAADTTTTNEERTEEDTKTEKEPMKNKKKDKKRKFDTTADSTQQKLQNQQNGQAEPADTSATNGVSKDADNEEEPATTKKEGKKRKSQVAADSTQEVTHNGHASNGESVEVQPVLSKKQRKEGRKKSEQGAALDDRPDLNGESENKEKKRKSEETAIAAEADGDTKNRASADEAPADLDATAEDKFDWRAALTRLVRDAGGRLSVAKLRKRLLKEYATAGKSSEKVERKFEKRLKTATELRVEGDKVVLAT